jgi:peptide alpha-N-acetyltransferase
VALFTREASDPLENLSEMQCVWFETEQAKAYLRAGDLGKALKKVHLVDSHFEQMIEDQFDFHT